MVTVRRRLLAVLSVVLVVTACSTLATIRADQRAELKAAIQAYDGVVTMLAVAREQSAFTQEQAAEIGIIMLETRAFLDEWAEQVKAGESTSGNWDELQLFLRHLESYAETKEGGN